MSKTIKTGQLWITLDKYRNNNRVFVICDSSHYARFGWNIYRFGVMSVAWKSEELILKESTLICDVDE